MQCIPLQSTAPVPKGCSKSNEHITTSEHISNEHMICLQQTDLPVPHLPILACHHLCHLSPPAVNVSRSFVTKTPADVTQPLRRVVTVNIGKSMNSGSACVAEHHSSRSRATAGLITPKRCTTPCCSAVTVTEQGASSAAHTLNQTHHTVSQRMQHVCLRRQLLVCQYTTL